MSFASGKVSKGLCSSYLQGLIPHKSTCRIYVRPSTFKLPKQTSTPIIMIGSTITLRHLPILNAFLYTVRGYELNSMNIFLRTHHYVTCLNDTHSSHRPWHWYSSYESPSSREKLSRKRQQRREEHLVFRMQEQKHGLLVPQ